MAGPTNVQHLHGGSGEPDGNGRLGQAIELVQARIDEEMKISDRISAKGRQLFALLSAFFAVAQALAFGGFGLGQLSGVATVILAVLGAFAVVALLVCGHRVADLEELIPESYVKPAQLLEWAQGGTDTTFGRQALVHMAGVADKRRAGNEKRARRYKKLEQSARVTLVLIGSEILIALIFRA